MTLATSAGSAHASDRDLGRRVLLHRFEVDADAGRGRRRHVGDDESRRDRVDRDTERPELDRERTGETLHAGLGRGVVGLPAIAQCRRTRQVDDPTPLRRRHVRLSRPAHQERTAQVDAEHRVPVVVGHLEQQVVPQHAGVVDEHGRRAEIGHDAVDRRRDRLRIRHVRSDRDRATAGGVDLPDGVRARRLIQVDHGDRMAIGREP